MCLTPSNQLDGLLQRYNTLLGIYASGLNHAAIALPAEFDQRLLEELRKHLLDLESIEVL
jgi:hypothetical protein